MPGAASAVSERIGIDTRGLAAFRITAGALLVVDLLLRAPHIGAFYTDRGVLPRSLHTELFPVVHSLSVHALFGSTLAQAALFAVAGVVAVAVVVGYRTTLATLLSVVLLVSLQLRNPLVLTAGDVILSVLLFFGIFLPLGARYSLDAARAGPDRGRVSNVRTAAPLLFVTLLVYGVNAITHVAGEAWTSGEAVAIVFGLDSTTVLLGDVLAGFPALLVALNWLWLGLLVAAPLLILATGRLRSLLTALFLLAHLGILFTLFLVTFPLANCVGLLLFLPSGAWDRIVSSVPTQLSESLDSYARRIDESLPLRGGSLPSHWPRPATRHLGSAAVVVVLLALSVWAVLSLGGPHPAGSEATHVSESTSYPVIVFSPEPLQTDGWYVAPAVLESGFVADAYRLQRVSWDRPPDLDRTYPGPRWTAYLIAGQYRLHAAPDPVVEGFAGYLCTRTGAHYAPAVETVTVYFVEDRGGENDTTRRRLTERACE